MPNMTLTPALRRLSSGEVVNVITSATEFNQ